MKAFINIVKEVIIRILNWQYYCFLRKIGKGVRIKSNVMMKGRKYISLEDNVTIAPNCFLQVIDNLLTSPPHLLIKQGSLIGRNTQISVIQSVTIGSDCIFAGNCFISDTTHSYNDITIPIIKSPLKKLKTVNIGDGSWLGRNASVIGASIGKHCIVGNCCMVTRDIPDYSVVVGNPCKIIKRYNTEAKQWQKTDKDGNFITK